MAQPNELAIIPREAKVREVKEQINLVNEPPSNNVMYGLEDPCNIYDINDRKKAAKRNVKNIFEEDFNRVIRNLTIFTKSEHDYNEMVVLVEDLPETVSIKFVRDYIIYTYCLEDDEPEIEEPQEENRNKFIHRRRRQIRSNTYVLSFGRMLYDQYKTIYDLTKDRMDFYDRNLSQF